MKKNIWILYLAVCLPLVVGAELKVATLAVLDFELPKTEEARGFARAAGNSQVDSFGAEIASFLNVSLSDYENLLLVEREDLMRLLAEQELGASGLADPQTAARIGRLLGAQVFVSGRVVEMGSRSFLVSRIVGTETGRVFSERVEFASREEVVDAVDVLAERVAGRVEDHYRAFIPEPEDPDAFIAALLPLVEGVELPSVSVEIPEEHLTRLIPDPAVETELQRALLALGFEVIDPAHSTRRPDIRILGEAFSEVGMRRGDLVACRARLEVKLIRTADGQLLHADRSTAVAVDLAEHVAAKEALARTARQTAEAIVRHLVPTE